MWAFDVRPDNLLPKNPSMICCPKTQNPYPIAQFEKPGLTTLSNPNNGYHSQSHVNFYEK